MSDHRLSTPAHTAPIIASGVERICDQLEARGVEVVSVSMLRCIAAVVRGAAA
jgi:hypothetical protein